MSNQSPSSLLGLVIQAFESNEPILLAVLLGWLESAELAVAGAAFSFLERTDCVDRVTPSISDDQFHDRYVDYLERCVLANSEDEWVHTRYEAAWALASWFNRALANNERHPRLIAFRDWLGVTYKAFPEVREAVVNGFLEHVVGQPSARKFFSKWERDSNLRPALHAARHWTDRGGDSPLDK